MRRTCTISGIALARHECYTRLGELGYSNIGGNPAAGAIHKVSIKSLTYQIASSQAAPGVHTMTSNSSVSGQGGCPAPFLEAQLFSSTGGCMLSALSPSKIAADQILVIDGRFCSPVGSITCCLPCPQTEWLYPDNFDTVTKSANWLNVASMVCSAFLLLSFAFLPVSKTHRHYLSICLTIAVVFMEVSTKALPRYYPNH